MESSPSLDGDSVRTSASMTTIPYAAHPVKQSVSNATILYAKACHTGRNDRLARSFPNRPRPLCPLIPTLTAAAQLRSHFHAKKWQEPLLQSGSIEHLSGFDGVVIPCYNGRREKRRWTKDDLRRFIVTRRGSAG